MDHSAPAEEHDALMGGDNHQVTDPTRQSDTPAFYIALVSLYPPPSTVRFHPLLAIIL